MRVILLLTILIIPCQFSSPAYLYAKDEIVRLNAHAYRFRLLTSDGKYVTDTLVASDRNEAVNLINHRYPNCVLYSVEEIR